jgi:hypothetical protein
MTQAYATTQVTVEKSQGEIRKLLGRFGAREFGFGEAVDDETIVWSAVTFVHGDLRVRLRVPHKRLNSRDLDARARRSRTKTRADLQYELAEQEARRIWRIMAHNLKARMIAVEEGVESFAEAFLAHIVDPETGATIYEQLSTTGSLNLAQPLAAIGTGE